MIYHVNWSYLYYPNGLTISAFNTPHTISSRYKLEKLPEWGDVLDFATSLANVIKESTKDSFCFLITKRQHAMFRTWIEQNNLKEFIAYEQPFWSTNAAHSHRDTSDGGLKFYVLQSPNHFQRTAAKDDPEITEDNFINYVDWPKDENT